MAKQIKKSRSLKQTNKDSSSLEETSTNLTPVTMSIENNIPLPKRGVRDPEFLLRAEKLLKKIKPKQSFVVPKSKLYSIQKLVKSDFPAYKIRSSVIKPENKFARVWRLI